MRSTNPFLIVLGLVVVLFALGCWGCEAKKDYREKQEKIKQAKAMVEECRTCPEEQLPDMLHRADPWGNDLMVKYNDGFVKSVTIISCGPDGKPKTKDDITATRHVKLDWKAGGSVVGEAGGDAVQGLWHGLKRSFTGDEKDQK